MPHAESFSKLLSILLCFPYRIRDVLWFSPFCIVSSATPNALNVVHEVISRCLDSQNSQSAYCLHLYQGIVFKAHYVCGFPSINTPEFYLKIHSPHSRCISKMTSNTAFTSLPLRKQMVCSQGSVGSVYSWTHLALVNALLCWLLRALRTSRLSESTTTKCFPYCSMFFMLLVLSDCVQSNAAWCKIIFKINSLQWCPGKISIAAGSAVMTTTTITKQ